MRQKGETTDAIVLEEIMRKPGATISEIADALGWTNGKVDGSVNRLIEEGKTLVKHCLKRGMLVKMVYPKEFVSKPSNVIEIPRQILNYDLWRENAIVYSLSRSTIGIAHKEIEEWDERAFSREIIHISKDDENVILELPSRFSSFYQLDNSDISLTSIGDLVLVTVESVLPVRLPPEYPEESKHAMTRYRMMIIESERIEGVSSFSLPFAIPPEGGTKSIRFSSQLLNAMVRRRPQEKILSTVSTSDPCNKLIRIPVEAK